ncbi:MAG TPA: PAS domain S-box protein [Kofleriaceae bacterium]|nr:PAS domain S-box protein [Kofleriaceae bacterium]
MPVDSTEARTRLDLFEQAPCAFHSANRDGVIQHVNQTWLDWLGYQREEVEGRLRFRELCAPESAATIEDAKQQFERDGQIRNCELIVLRKDGTRISIRASSTLATENGEVVGTRTAFIDVTSGREELPFRELVDAAPDGIVVCDRSGTIVLVNLQAERMFDYPRAELIGKTIEFLIPERFRDRHPSHVQRYVSSPRARPMGTGLELFGRRRDGTEFPVEISLSPIQSPQGTMMSAAIRDVTDRKRIEAEARRANAYLLSAVDSIQDAFSLYDEEDRVVLVNSAFRGLFSQAFTGPVVGRRFEDVLDAIVKTIDTKGSDPSVVRKRWLSYHTVPSGVLEVQTKEGRALRVVERTTAEHGTVSLIVDVTEDQQRADELRRAREQAEAASAAKSEFLASMSHELRTPMNAVLGFAQLLQRDRKQPLSERQQERIEHVLRGGEHLLRLIDEVLDLSRIEAGAVTISAEPVGVREVLDEVVSTLEPMASRAQIQIAIAPLSSSLPPVVADRTRLAQILMNFGSNAIKYNKAGGHVTFRVSRGEKALRLAVVDDGIGIPEAKRSKIFEPFQRAGQETGPIEGTGIGLAISKRLAELMKGSVGFASETGKGSEFWVEVPIAQVAPAQEAPTVEPQETWLAQGGQRRKIVYVEDNPSNIAFMREVMDDFSSIELITAPTAEIGLELIRAHQPAVVIMDINLPGMSGFDAVKLLKEWPDTRQIPVIALTAAALVKDTARARELGFHRYLTKPIKIDELASTLHELLG